MSPPLRCVVVEDEAESRESLAGWLSAAPGCTLVGMAATGPEAVDLVERERPGLVLLDIRLPGMDGIEVLRRLGHRPDVVFTTAHEDYAVAAFELGAVDYLLKPFGRERLLAALARAQARLGASPAGSSAVDRALEASSPPLRRIFARKGNKVVPIRVRDLVRVSASGEYSELHTARESFLVRIPLRELSARLDPDTFEQVHRSHLVNLDEVDHLSAVDDRRLLLTLRDGTRVVASRSASERLRRRFR
jgi:two-component system LytT family response regulator